MSEKPFKLYDENIVHNIIVSTGFTIAEYLRENPNADEDEICDFIEVNAEAIINDTVWHLKNIDKPYRITTD
jgi:hypothetical protein